jgi:hypothetical protein
MLPPPASRGCIPEFPLGTRDLKLYGRTREIDTLLAAFDRVVSRGTTELVLVSGYSGVGKSSIVKHRKSPIAADGTRQNGNGYPCSFVGCGADDRYTFAHDRV